MKPWVWDERLKAASLVFDSTAAFLDFQKAPYGSGHHQRASETGSRSFSCTDSLAHAEQLVRDGWSEGAERARAMSARFTSSTAEAATAERQATVFDETGEEPDIDRYLDGEAECMMDYTTEHVPAAGRVVTLAFDGWVAARVDEADIQKAATMIASLVDVLEASDIRCEFVCRYRGREVWVDGNKDRDVELEHRVKAAHQPLDLPKLVAAMHPSSFRRIVFRWLECLPGIDDGYGFPSKSQRHTEGTTVPFSMSELSGKSDAEVAEWLEGWRTKLMHG